jgi:FtsP/CotA-like multicopper oxidase with cupredoxin domain
VAAAALIGSLASPGSGGAAEYWLRADATTISMPDGAAVVMWGYALDADGDFATIDGTVRVPGPALTVPPGETLTIHLKNNLPEPTSIVIPGQIPDSMEPVRFTEGGFAGRIRSFAAEAAANGGEQTYAWTNVPFRPGTFLYQSGSHPGIQVPMGLYGAVTADAAPGEAYPGVSYDTSLTLLFSEIDPAQHAAVANGTYGSPDYPGTLVVGYRPKYFLINGVPFSEAAPPPAQKVGGTVLLRFLNAGLRGRMPVIQNNFVRLVAEDGNPKPFPGEQSSLDLPAGMTIDAILQPSAPGRIAVFDRSMGLSNAGLATGGMYAFLRPAAVVLQPNGGEVLTTGAAYPVRWTEIQGAVNYRVWYSLDGGGTWVLIGDAGPATSLDWNVPSVAVTKAASLVRVAAFDAVGRQLSIDSSDGRFTVVSPFAVISPNGGELLSSGTTQTIQWNAAPGAASYRLHYSLDNGATWAAIRQVGAVTSFDWVVPAVAAAETDARVRVNAFDDAGVLLFGDRSDGAFTIQP